MNAARSVLSALLTAPLLLTACASGPQADAPPAPVLQAQITWGQRDAGEHPYVGTLLFVQNGVGYYSCTGTLLSPTVMLTAGHCVEEGGNENDVTYVSFAEDPLATRSQYGTTSEWLEEEWILATDVVPHPNYDDYAAFPDTYDIGLVILSEAVAMETYGELSPLGYFGTTSQARLKAQLFESVGYGAQAWKPATSNKPIPDEYARYKGQQRFIGVGSSITGTQSVKFTNNPGNGNGGGGTCFGDSGGPTFLNDTNIIAAITSFGVTANCKGNDYSFRLDTALAQDFITPYLP
ncbi:trypsin-like serine protease [Deinococcus sp. MIMF12]|uniref:Trypsin-like serine protease n=1 Tax=Deinococcus rhizophilus TaxID=3049544 RepID=A0ABT7JFF2_9DEIO|nr:trypsin-like serine protease [Deinococcus rhizophilus]MDL2343780.1 trypsin-like serine protease [Deinococcus rhizophilus]